MTQRTRIHSDRLLPVDPSTATTTNCPRRISAPANLERLQLSALSRRPQDPPLRLRACRRHLAAKPGTWPCTAFTPRPTRLATSRMESGPAPHSAFNSSHRLAVRTRHSSSGLAKPILRRVLGGRSSLPLPQL